MAAVRARSPQLSMVSVGRSLPAESVQAMHLGAESPHFPEPNPPTKRTFFVDAKEDAKYKNAKVKNFCQ